MPGMTPESLLQRVAAIVVSYDTEDALESCLAVLTAAPRLEVLVVDNSSRDASVEVARRHLPAAQVIEAGSNLGFGAAVNLGLSHTSREFVVTLNPDCIAPAEALEELAQCLAADPTAGFAGPRILLESGKPDHASLRADPDPVAALIYFSQVWRLFPRSPRLNRYSLRHLDYSAEQDLQAGMGACLMFRGEALRAVGGFDTSFFMYGEDLDVCRRIRARGFRGRYVPSAVVTHMKGAATRKHSRRMLVEFHRAMWRYYQVHEAPSRSPLVNAAVGGGIMALAAARIAVNAVRREKRVSAR